MKSGECVGVKNHLILDLDGSLRRTTKERERITLRLNLKLRAAKDLFHSHTGMKKNPVIYLSIYVLDIHIIKKMNSQMLMAIGGYIGDKFSNASKTMINFGRTTKSN